MADLHEPAGSARLHLVGGVSLLRPEDVVLKAMCDGYSAHLIGSRGLQHKTVTTRLGVVGRFVTYTNQYRGSGLRPISMSG